MATTPFSWTCCGITLATANTMPETVLGSVTVSEPVPAPELVPELAEPVATAEPAEPAPELVPERAEHTFSHYGKGILPGAFVKPEPGLTRAETRRHVTHELNEWLTGDLCADATEIAYREPLGSAIVKEGKWPAGRLYMLHCLLTEQWDYIPGATILDEMRVVANWAKGVCLKHLAKPLDKKSRAIDLALGFITEDLLPGGDTIITLWNQSPFGVLREAPPLPESEDEDEDEEDEEEDEEDEDEDEDEDEEEDEDDDEDDDEDEEDTGRFSLNPDFKSSLLNTWIGITSGILVALLLDRLAKCY